MPYNIPRPTEWTCDAHPTFGLLGTNSSLGFWSFVICHAGHAADDPRALTPANDFIITFPDLPPPSTPSPPSRTRPKATMTIDLPRNLAANLIQHRTAMAE
ncbi:MAG: hypothetical protein K1X78_12605 [Verrucomicrobiaceae bacterium]|nr:hypothetical protein [Verrucomicrobiaceae bacterium]